MAVTIGNHFVQQYTTNIQLLLQQKGSKLRSLVQTGSHVGKQAAVVDQIGSIAMNAVSSGTRFQAMGRVDPTHDRRWVFPSDFDLPQLIDSFDKLRLLTDPSSAYVQNAVYAAGRQMDDLIIAAAFGTAKTGEAGATSTSFDSNNVVASDAGETAGTHVGLTVKKLRAAKKILMANEVDLEADPITVIVTAAQHDNLLAELQITNLEYNDRPVLVEGKVTRFLGMNFVHCERLGVDASDYRRVPVFAKSGLYLGLWNDVTTDISQRKDLQGLPWQAYVYMTAGATRTDEKKVVEIKCAE